MKLYRRYLDENNFSVIEAKTFVERVDSVISKLSDIQSEFGSGSNQLESFKTFKLIFNSSVMLEPD